jgi:hypothetical protein
VDAAGAEVEAFVDFGERRHTCDYPRIPSAELAGVTRARQQLVERNRSFHPGAALRLRIATQWSAFVRGKFSVT